MTASRARRSGVAAVAVLGLLLAGGCAATVVDQPQESITLRVDIFGGAGFGYEDLYPEFERTHPNIKIEERGRGRNLSDLTMQMDQWFASGAGAGDVVGIEEGTIARAMEMRSKFRNLLDYGAGSMSNQFIGWKWAQGMTPDGKMLLGLGTDVGGMAMCYRKDLFAQAGLPTDREAVSKLWPDWDSYIATGQHFNAANTGASFVDSATNVFFTQLLQIAGNDTGYTFYDRNEKFVLAENPNVAEAWQLANRLIAADLSARVEAWSDPWRDGFKNSKFATIACPAWMTGHIKEAAGDSIAGKWDIARVPGDGGNWGGSFLAVPTQSKHPKEATELAMFLTGSHGQVVAFQKTGNLPSNIKALDDPAVAGATNAYFSNAPTGQIFAAGAKNLKPVYMGTNNQVVRDAVETALRAVELGRITPDAGWKKALSDGAEADVKAKADPARAGTG